MSGETIGDRLHATRAALGWSLRKLAMRSGVSHAQINQIERGITQDPGTDTIQKLSNALGKELLAEQGAYESELIAMVRRLRPFLTSWQIDEPEEFIIRIAQLPPEEQAMVAHLVKRLWVAHHIEQRRSQIRVQPVNIKRLNERREKYDSEPEKVRG